ncbi:MAG: hypothetical protein ACI4AA_05930 [Lachnospiraceae bacterium]
MKKLIGLFMILILVTVFPLEVKAQNQTVTISSAKASTTSVAVTGNTAAIAIIVQVRDASDNILDMQSFGTVDGAFAAELTNLSLTDGAKYKLFIADYEGGDWATIEVIAEKGTTTVIDNTQTNPTQANTAQGAGTAVNAPKTGDVHNPVLWALLLALGCLITKMAGKYYKRYSSI